MKQKRYWLRGGIVGGLLLTLYVFVGGIISNIFSPCLGACPPSLDTTFKKFLVYYITDFHYLFYSLKVLPVCFVIGFVVGVILGWLYGKFKNRNKVV